MSCGNGEACYEIGKRRIALGALGLMLVIFLALSAVSFLDSRNQVIPSTVQFDSHEAVDGKRVFQAYNCMGCHTIVGNGAYLGPDLTKTYEHVGPAWLAAFLPSAGSWPTAAAVRAQLQNPELAKEAGANTLEAYLAKYPGAAERVQRRGGLATLMPNLPFRSDEPGQLIAFLKYTALMNNEGWPPKPKVDGLKFPYAKHVVTAVTANTPGAPGPAAPVAATTNPVALGEKIAKDNGCMACHDSGKKRVIGPGWGGLYGSQVTLTDGSKVTADDAYIAESILKPNTKIVAGYAAGLMPAYETLLSKADVDAIAAYIRSLSGEAK